MPNSFNRKIYGNPDVEPVIVELINSKPVQRLKHIHQNGADYLFKQGAISSRFDHSIGVMLLLGRLNASLKEQIAGLLHDVSHTVFSHVVDYMIGKSLTQSHQDDIFEEYVLNSEIPDILAHHKIKIDSILSSKFTLLDRPIPALCADRLDYLIRDAAHYGRISVPAARAILDGLMVDDDEIVFNDVERALMAGYMFIDIAEYAYTDPLSIFINQVLAKAVQRALDLKIIKPKDLFTTDKKVENKLRKSNDSEIIRLLALISPDTQLTFSKRKFDYHLTTKVRYIDPPIRLVHGVRPLSEVNAPYRKALLDSIKKQKEGFYVKVIDSSCT